MNIKSDIITFRMNFILSSIEVSQIAKNFSQIAKNFSQIAKKNSQIEKNFSQNQ